MKATFTKRTVWIDICVEFSDYIGKADLVEEKGETLKEFLKKFGWKVSCKSGARRDTYCFEIFIRCPKTAEIEAESRIKVKIKELGIEI